MFLTFGSKKETVPCSVWGPTLRISQIIRVPRLSLAQRLLGLLGFADLTFCIGLGFRSFGCTSCEPRFEDAQQDVRQRANCQWHFLLRAGTGLAFLSLRSFMLSMRIIAYGKVHGSVSHRPKPEVPHPVHRIRKPNG